MYSEQADPLMLLSPSAPPPPRSRRTSEPTPAPEVCPDPVQFARQSLDFHPDPHQAAILSGRHHRLMLNCSRQWGKSTVTAAKAIHVALTQPGALILVAAPVGRQSAEFVEKCESFLYRLGIKPRGDGKNSISIRFPNRSRLIGVPGSREANIRGFSAVSLLIIDEAARVSDELYHAATPMLSVGDGDLWLLSTPYSTTGFFYQEWKFGEGWEKIAVPATECPRISPEFLENQRTHMGDHRFRREYLCEFHDLGGTLFVRELIDRAFTSEVSLLPLATRHSPLVTTNHQPLTTNHFYIGLDLGQKCDFTAIAVLERRDPPKPHFLAPWTVQPTYFDLRHLERLPLGTPYPRVIEKVAKLTNHPTLKNRCTVVADSTGVGQPVVDELRRAQLGGNLIPVTISGGGQANRNGHGWTVPRRDLLSAVMLTLEDEHLRFAEKLPERARLVAELMSLHAGPGRNRNNEHDDLVFALALATWRAKAEAQAPFGHQSTGRII